MHKIFNLKMQKILFNILNKIKFIKTNVVATFGIYQKIFNDGVLRLSEKSTTMMY